MDGDITAAIEAQSITAVRKSCMDGRHARRGNVPDIRAILVPPHTVAPPQSITSRGGCGVHDSQNDDARGRFTGSCRGVRCATARQAGRPNMRQFLSAGLVAMLCLGVSVTDSLAQNVVTDTAKKTGEATKEGAKKTGEVTTEGAKKTGEATKEG